ncbi:hypothetical protein BH10PSE12_BH10PSE12_20740 [soil metagenome]
MTGWLLEALLAATVLMALVMLVRRPIARHLDARAAYMLWALPLLRMMLPPLPSGAAAVSMLPAATGQHDPIILLQAHVADAGVDPLPWMEALIALWMLGVIAFFLLQIVGYIRFRRLLLSDGTPIGHEGRVRRIASVHATGPLAFGVLRKYVVLPIDFADRYDAQERAMVLAHEHAHHYRGDLAANMIALALLGLNWCNPIAWLAYRAFRADQELACDATVLARHGGSHAQAYGRAIVKAASGRHFAAFCHLNTIDTLKGRLKMLSSHSASLHRISWGMAVIAATIVAGLALTASGSRAAQGMAAFSDKVDGAQMNRLASFLPQRIEARATPEPAQPEDSRVADAQVAETTHTQTSMPHATYDAIAPMAAISPVAPVPPVAPMPPPIPRVDVDRVAGRVTVRLPGGEIQTHRFPSQMQIAAMRPDIRSVDDCGLDGVDPTTQSGRMQMRRCNQAIARQVQAEVQRAQRQARADIAQHNADMRQMMDDRVQARADLRQALEDRREAQREAARAGAEAARARAD